MAERTTAQLVWKDDLRFEAESRSGHRIVLDSVAREGHQGPSPMELLLIGVAGCTAMDVVAILKKMRERLTGLEVSIAGDRAEANPKYYTSLTVTYRVRGVDLSEEKVRRAVDLSHGTYCSASASLRPDCRIDSVIEIVPEGPGADDVS